MKGTIAHALTGYTFVCLPSANNLEGLDTLLDCLKANGTTETIEAFNINKLTDKETGNLAANLREKLFTHGFKVTSAIWGDKSHNSVDDYFFHRISTKRNHVYDVDILAAIAV